MEKLFLSLGLSIFLVAMFAGPLVAGTIKDSESASHDDTAAIYDLVDTYKGDGFKILQFNLAVLSHYSYVLISGNEALIVDPGRDIQTYLDLLKKDGLVCRGVFLTHSHADFVAGHVELAKALGCKVYASAVSGAEYPFEPLRDDSKLEIGEALVSFIETPGHTPDGVSGLVSSRKKPSEPDFLFTGDTLFIGSVGRPDLMGGTTSAAALAGMLYDTWINKLSKLPDSVSIFPAHGAGSLCGAHLSDEPTSTIGVQKQTNAYLQQIGSRNAFIATVLDGLPEAPQYFKHNAQMNRMGPEIIDWAAEPVFVTPEPGLTDVATTYVVDIRDAASFAAGHIPNSVNIGVRGRIETWVGIMVPWGSKLVLCGNREEVQEAFKRLHRVGYKARGVTWESWLEAALPVARNQRISPTELHSAMKQGSAPMIVDVRLPTEWMGLRIGQVLNLPLNRLAETAPVKLEKDQPVVTVCNSAYRSSMAVGILERTGFTQGKSLDGGGQAWIEAGFPVFGSTAENPSGHASKAATGPTGPSTPLRSVYLPDRLSPAALNRMIIDLPGTFELIDLRPAQAAADYNPINARPVDVAEVLGNPAMLVGNIPLVIVDRDGSLAMIVAGILSQKTKRPIKALHGGMEAYWAETERLGTAPDMGARASPNPARGVPTPTIVPGANPTILPGNQSSPITPPPQPAPKAKKKRSAGC